MIAVEIRMKTGERFLHTEIGKVFVEDGFYCLLEPAAEKTYRYPVANVLRITEANNEQDLGRPNTYTE